MLKRSDVRRVVDEAAVQFEQCWALLARLKSGNLPGHAGLSILQFQPTLATALSELSSIYRRLGEEKEAAVRRKTSLSPTWFARRMRFLSSEQGIARRAVFVGKSIGDGFAWFFYQNNIDYLHEHLKEPAQLFMPTGVGGFAELETVRKIPVANGHFLLYHGITSVLRLGDFSLVDLKDLRVVTVGEIKAGKPADGKLRIQMNFPCNPITGEALESPKGPRSKKEPVASRDTLSASAKDRLSRQMQRMASAHSKLTSRPDRSLSFEMENRLKEFDQFVSGIRRGRCSFMRMGDSVLLIGLPMWRAGLYTRMAKDTGTGWKPKLAGVEREALAIVIPGRQDNAIYVGSWFYDEHGTVSHRPGMTHPIWWPLSAENLRRIIFQEVLLFSAYNPAHLVQRLERAGFAVTETSEREFSAQKQIGDRVMQLAGIPHYFEFIQRYFLSEDDVVAMLQQVEDQIPSMPGKGSGRIDLQFVQRFGRPPRAGKGDAPS